MGKMRPWPLCPVADSLEKQNKMLIRNENGTLIGHIMLTKTYVVIVLSNVNKYYFGGFTVANPVRTTSLF
jgi:hypothetical protein